MSTAGGLGSLRDKDGDTLLHIYCSPNFPSEISKFPKRKDIPSQHKNFVKSLRQDEQWLLRPEQVSGLISRGCDPNASNNRGETPLTLLWERYKRAIQTSRDRGGGGAPPGKKERAAMSLLREHGAHGDKQMAQDILRVSWSQVLGFRQPGKQGPVLDPALILDWTPYRHLFMCSGPEQAEILHGLISGLIARPPSDPVLTYDFLHAAAGITNPEATRGSLLMALLRAMYTAIEDNPRGAREFFLQRRDAVQHIVNTFMGDSKSEAVNVRDTKTGRTPLHYATLIGNLDIINALLGHPLLNESLVDEDFQTPLTMSLNELKRAQWLTTGSPKLSAVKALVGVSRRLELVARDGSTALLTTVGMLVACGRPYKERQAYSILGQHLDGQTMVPAGRESSALLLCVDLDLPGVLREIIEQRLPSLNVHARDEDGMNALHLAGIQGRAECARELIAACPSLCNVQDFNGNTPLFYLVTSLRPGDTLALLRNFQSVWDFSLANNRYESVLDYYRFKADDFVQSSGIEEVLQALVTSAGGSAGSPSSPVVSNLRTDPKLLQSMSAAAGRRYSQDPERQLRDYVRDLFTLQDIFAGIVDGSRAMVNHAVHGKTAAMILAGNGLVEELKHLMDSCEVDLNIKDAEGKTALHLAAASGNAECVHVIVRDVRVDLDGQDKKGNSPLFYLVENFTADEAHVLIRQYEWNFHVMNYSNQNVADYYACSVTHPDETVITTLRKKCAGTSSGAPQSPPSAPMSEYRTSNPDVVPLSPTQKIRDEALSKKRPSVGELTIHLEGLMRKPGRGSKLFERPRLGSSPGPGEEYPQLVSPKTRVKSFSYLESEAPRRSESLKGQARSSYPQRAQHKSVGHGQRVSYPGAGASASSSRGLERTSLEEGYSRARPRGEGPPVYPGPGHPPGGQAEPWRGYSSSPTGYGLPKPPLANR